MTTTDWLWLGLVAVGVATMHFFIRFVFKKVEAKYAEKDSHAPSYLLTLKHTFIAFVWITGLFLASYSIFEKDLYDTISGNIKRFAWICFIVIVSVVLNAIVLSIIDKRIEESLKSDDDDPTTYKFLKYLATATIYIFGAILIAHSIPALRSLAQSALAGAGVLAVVIGVASQEALANVIGGLFIVIFKPFKVGDILKIGETDTGRVEDLTLRHTVINNFQNKRIVIPNSVINKEKIINYNLGERKICEWVEIGISYDSDIDKALAIMAEEAENHPYFYDNRTVAERKHEEPKVRAKVIGFGDSSVNLRAWVWARNYPSGFNMRVDLYKSIKERFDKDGIEIPFPYRTLVMKQAQTKISLEDGPEIQTKD